MGLVYRPNHPQANEFGMVPSEIAGPRNPGKSLNVIPDVQPFISPIDRSVITSRSQIREHERKHGVYQIGNDWCGREKPAWWDEHRSRSK